MGWKETVHIYSIWHPKLQLCRTTRFKYIPDKQITLYITQRFHKAVRLSQQGASWLANSISRFNDFLILLAYFTLLDRSQTGLYVQPYFLLQQIHSLLHVCNQPVKSRPQALSSNCAASCHFPMSCGHDPQFQILQNDTTGNKPILVIKPDAKFLYWHAQKLDCQ